MNVVDSLVVTIGLDGTQFGTSSTKTIQQVEKTKDTIAADAHSAGDAVVKAVDESLGKITNQLLKLFFAFLGAVSLKEFGQATTRAEVSLGVLSQSLATTPEQLSAFDQAVERVGGSSEETNASLSRLNTMIMEFNLHGVRAPDWFYQIGGMEINSRASKVDQAIKLAELIQRYTAHNPSGVQIGYHALEQIGFDSYTAKLILQGPSRVREAVDAAGPSAVTASQIKSGQEVLGAFERASQNVQAYGRQVLDLSSGPLTEFLDKFSTWMEGNKNWLAKETEKFLIGNISDEEWQKPLKLLSKIQDALGTTKAGINSVVDAIDAVDGAVSHGLLDALVSLRRAIGVAPAALWGVVHALEALVERVEKLVGISGAHSTTLGSAPASIRARGSGVAPAQPDLPLATVEGPVSMSRPLPVKLNTMPYEEDTFGGLVSKLVGKASDWFWQRSGGSGSEGIGTPVAQPLAPGTFRPVYPLTDKDLSDEVVNTIVGEADPRDPGAIDAVINNAFNRLGSQGYGPSGNLKEVFRSPGQYTGYRVASPREAELVRSRIRAIASGGMPDTTHGSMEYRGAWLYDSFKARHPEGAGIGGNWFFRTPTPIGPYKAYETPRFVTPPSTLPYVPPKPAADSAAEGAKSSMIIRRSQFQIAHVEVNSRATSSAGLVKDIRVVLQKEIEQNMALA